MIVPLIILNLLRNLCVLKRQNQLCGSEGNPRAGQTCVMQGFFNFLSFCHVFIQWLACNPKPGCLCPLQHILSSAEYVTPTYVPDDVFYNTAEQQTLTHTPYRFVMCSGANPKKPSAPDMFTESDDMFAADFDVRTS